MIVDLTVDQKITFYFNCLLDLMITDPETWRDCGKSCLSDNCFSTVNLLDLVGTKNFGNYLDDIRHLCQSHVKKRIKIFLYSYD